MKINSSGKIIQRSDVIFIVPSFKRESVSFVVFQYVVFLRSRGIDARIFSIKRREILLPKEMSANIFDIILAKLIISNLFIPDVIGYFLYKIIPSLQWIPFLHCDIVMGMVGEKKRFRRLRVFLWQRILQRAQHIISPTRYASSNVHSTALHTILPHGIDLNIDKLFRELPAKREDSRLPVLPSANAVTGGRRYVFIGRDTPTKRLRAMVKLIQHDKTAGLLVIGPPGGSHSYFDSLDIQLRERCHFMGSQMDPFSFLTDGDIVVCPSGREGFGMVPIECLARGIAVAAIDEGAFRELYGGSDILFRSIEQVVQRVDIFRRGGDPLKRRFVGRFALDVRVDVLERLVRNERREESECR